MEPDSEPRKLTIVTVVFNAADLLEATIRSVCKTEFPQIEYIVIDGGSQDGTLDIIHDNSDSIDIWISDRDKGLYDAMNKGLHLASGEFIWFVNAGDHIASSEILQKILSSISSEIDVIYGEVMIVDENRKELGTRSELSTQKLPMHLSWRDFRFGMCVSHQGFIVRKEIAPDYKLNNLSADVEWCIECLKASRKNTLIPGIFVNYLAGGVSKKKWKKSIIDRYVILKKHFGLIPNIIAHLIILVRAFFHKLFRMNKITY